MYKIFVKKLLDDIKMQQVNFIMICINQKILVLLKITVTLKRFLRSVTDFYFLKTNYFCSQHIMIES